MTKARRKAWPRKVLDEMITFIEQQHEGSAPLSEIAKVTGLSVVNISAIFMRDDMKLSKAEYIAERYGYRLRLFFPLREYPIIMENHISKRNFPDAGNLEGLVKYLYDSNISITHMSKRVDRSYDMLIKAFTTGDIILSNLYQIIDNLNIEVIWIFEQKTTD